MFSHTGNVVELKTFFPTDVCSQKHSRYTTELPWRHHHVLQTSSVWLRLQRRQRPLPDAHGLLSPGRLLHIGFQLFLGLLAAQPPAGLAAPIVAHRPPHASPLPPSPHATDSHVAPCLSAQWLPAAPSSIGAPRPEMRLRGGLRGARREWYTCSQMNLFWERVGRRGFHVWDERMEKTKVLLFPRLVFLNWRWAVCLCRKRLSCLSSSKSRKNLEVTDNTEKLKAGLCEPKKHFFGQNSKNIFHYRCNQSQDPSEHFLRIGAMWSGEVLCDFFFFSLIGFRNNQAGSRQ